MDDDDAQTCAVLLNEIFFLFSRLSAKTKSAKNVFFTLKYFRVFALVLRNSIEPAIVVFVFLMVVFF